MRKPVITVLLIPLMLSFVYADSDKERDACTQQIAGLATCLPYVAGDAKSPTPDCCSGLKQVLKNNKKCLCVIIKDRNDPDLGLQLNLTLTLGLPSLCNAPANISQCPALLNLDPNSPEAQDFYQLGTNSSTKNAETPTPSPTDGKTSYSPSSRIAPQKGEVCFGAYKWLGFENGAVFGGLLLCFFYQFIVFPSM